MQLDKYISQTIYSVMKALKDVDTRLQRDALGCVWTADFKTLAHDLVAVRLAKGEDPANPSKSVPVVLFDYDVNLAVDDEKGAADQAELGVGGMFLQVINFSGKVGGSSSKKHSEKEVQNLKFTVPVSMIVAKK